MEGVQPCGNPGGSRAKELSQPFLFVDFTAAGIYVCTRFTNVYYHGDYYVMTNDLNGTCWTRSSVGLYMRMPLWG